MTYLKNENGHKDTITDIEWCNQFGRTFHLIASSSIDTTMKIWKLDFTYSNNNDGFDNFTIKFEIIHNFQNNLPVIKKLNRYGDSHGIFLEH